MTIRQILAVAALFWATASASALAQGSWASGPAIPEGGNEVIGAVVASQILVYGGQTGDSKPVGALWRFDPAAGAWTKLAGNPVPVHHGAAVGIGGKMYLFGGFRIPDSGKTAWHPVADAWAYDLEKQGWEALPPMPTPRGALSAVAVGSKVYVIGGAKLPAKIDQSDGIVPGGPVELLGTVEVYDTETKSWAAKTPMSLARNHHDAAHVNGKIYVVGGRVASCYSNGWSTNVWMNEAYDIAADSWTTLQPMPTARSGTGIAVIDGKLHVLGGEGWIDNFGGVFRTHEVYDPATNRWSIAPRMPTARHGFATAQLGNRIYAISGVNNAGGSGPLSVLTVNEVFTP
jgi:N-acetylneuraminic acid mutarotase